MRKIGVPVGWARSSGRFVQQHLGPLSDRACQII